jgi:hypothetical protein
MRTQLWVSAVSGWRPERIAVAAASSMMSRAWSSFQMSVQNAAFSFAWEVPEERPLGDADRFGDLIYGRRRQACSSKSASAASQISRAVSARRRSRSAGWVMVTALSLDPTSLYAQSGTSHGRNGSLALDDVG